jgi:hypothetical protein
VNENKKVPPPPPLKATRAAPQPPAPPVAAAPPAPAPPPAQGPAVKPVQTARSARASNSPGSLFGASTQQKLDLASAALKLRDEQVSARVVYFDPEQETNAELDQITESVIAELRAIQSVRVARTGGGPPKPAANREAELVETLHQSLDQVLDPARKNFLRVKLDAISRKITTLYFAYVLGHEAAPEEIESRLIDVPEQALYYALMRVKEPFLDALQVFSYESEELYNHTLDRLTRLEKELQVAFLGRKAPELEKLLPVVNSVFMDFLTTAFRQQLADFSATVVRESGAAQQVTTETGNRIGVRGFQRFREVFERHFMERLIMGVQEPLLTRLDAMNEDTFHPETIDFISNPQVLSVVCGVLCDAFYDHFHSEGLLDLPNQWRQHTGEVTG